MKSAQTARLSQPHLPVSGNKGRLSFTLFILCKSGFVILIVFFFLFFFILFYFNFFLRIQHLRGKLSRDALSAVCAVQVEISQALSHVKQV